MNRSIKIYGSCILGLVSLNPAMMAHSCDDGPEPNRQIAYEIVERQPQVRVVEIVRAQPCHVQNNTTNIQQTTIVYNVVNIAQTPPSPREPHIPYSYIRN